MEMQVSPTEVLPVSPLPMELSPVSVPVLSMTRFRHSPRLMERSFREIRRKTSCSGQRRLLQPNLLYSMSILAHQLPPSLVQTITQHHLLLQESWEQPMHKLYNLALQVRAISTSSVPPMSLIHLVI